MDGLWTVGLTKRNPEALTLRQERFANEVVKGTSIKDAAAIAGYSHKNAHRAGTYLLNNEPKVKKRVAELRNRASARASLTLAKHLDNLATLRDKAMDNGAYGAAVTAEINRGKAAGLYIDRRELLVNRVTTMSRDDVIRRIQEIHEQTGLPSVTDDGSLTIEHVSK